MEEETKAYQILLQMFEIIERKTHRSSRECFNTLVRFLADCTRVHPIPESEHQLADELWPLTMPFVEAFYKEPQDYLGTLFSKKECGNDNLGQIITPRAVVRYINDMTIGELDGETDEADDEEADWQFVLDPCTGTGRFLFEAALQFPKRKLVFFGVELDLDLYRAALVNMRLIAWHQAYYILRADTLIVNVRPNSPNWQYANRWDPPNWETQMVMEDGQTWAEWREQNQGEGKEAPVVPEQPRPVESDEPPQPRLFCRKE